VASSNRIAPASFLTARLTANGSVRIQSGRSAFIPLEHGFELADLAAFFDHLLRHQANIISLQ
jgi:hypothetical protein